MIFLSCPPVYTLPGTWTKCNAIIPHYNADPNYTFGISLLVILVLHTQGLDAIYFLYLVSMVCTDK